MDDIFEVYWIVWLKWQPDTNVDFTVYITEHTKEAVSEALILDDDLFSCDKVWKSFTYTIINVKVVKPC